MNILFVTESFTTAIRLVPIYLQALQVPGVKPYIYCDNTDNEDLRKLFAENNVTPLTKTTACTAAELQQIESELYQYEIAASRALGQIDPSTYTYKGVPILPRFSNYMLKRNREKLSQSLLFDKLNEKLSIDALVVAYDSGTVKKLFVNRANTFGIPTVHVQYAYGVLKKGAPSKQLNSQYYCLWGELARERYLHDESIGRERVFITGNPTFELHRYNSESIRQELGIAGTQRVFLVNLVVPLPMADSCIEELSRTRGGEDDLFIFKLHPNLYPYYDEYQKKLEKTSLRFKLYHGDESVYRLLSAADYLLTHSTDTLFFEAFNFGTKVVLLENPHMGDIPDSIKRGVLTLTTFENLYQAIDTKLAEVQQHFEAVKQESLFQCDGQASKRILDICIDLAEKNNRAVDFVSEASSTALQQ